MLDSGNVCCKCGFDAIGYYEVISSSGKLWLCDSCQAAEAKEYVAEYERLLAENTPLRRLEEAVAELIEGSVRFADTPMRNGCPYASVEEKKLDDIIKLVREIKEIRK
jgi:hypothetical protein